ncbi:hypothetical protein ACOSQ2_004944 [Xanthoceras sorbifolium]
MPLSDLAKYKFKRFKVHMRRVEKESGEVVVTYNYCNKYFKWNKSGAYGTYWKHINTKHPVEAQHERNRGQYQISRNLRIREETAKYLLNLDVNSAYYDPITRYIREDPLPDAGSNEKFYGASASGQNFVKS